MNPAHIRDIITAVKSDKSIVQPWRNKVVARLEEAIAFIHEGQNTSNLKPPAGMTDTSADGFTKTAECTCAAWPDMPDPKCPVHGS